MNAHVDTGRLRCRLARMYLTAAFLLLATTLTHATTTSGATVRNVNTADGIVTLGALPGSNGVDWETDEVFQGFSGAVNWYLTWDDNNVYLGRIGGNNAEGSVIYIKAEYPGATYDNRAFDYDLLNPDVTPMGGVNFAAYLKTGYHEYRTYNGAWSSATAGTLNPQLTMQGPTAHMEVTIPWSAITAGNGRPTNIRLVLYQVVPTGIACADEFVYGESPWGTGNPGDGPSVGVNDGQPISARQPGGCNTGDSTATRWWGCYPVIGGVGSNGWMAAMPNAGPDDSICQTATAYFLTGNTPPAQAVGTWSVVSQPAGSPPVGFTAANNPNSFANNLTGIGVYTFIWDINYNGCPSVPDTVFITRVPNSSTSSVMPDTVLSCNQDSLVLRGNDPGNGSGFWTVVTGGGTILNPTDSITPAFGLSPGVNQFQYSITNGVCPTTNAIVNVTVPIDVTADVGPDIELCNGTITTLAANDPSQIQASAYGIWTPFSGPSNVVFTNPSLNTTNVSSLVSGVYQLVWTVSNFNCPSVSDTLTITNYDNPVADAGGDQSLCLGGQVLLDGNDFAFLGASSAGLWSQLSGPNSATITNPLQYNTSVGNLVAGYYLFSWRVENGTCPADSDNVGITVVSVQDNGVANTIVPDSGMSNGTIVLAQPITGTPPFLYSIDGLNFGGELLFDSLASGTYTFFIMDANGCSDSLTATLGYIPPVDTIPTIEPIKIPTGFSPNGDDNNDTWEIPGIGQYPDAVIEVFNIWGGMVYRSVGNYTPWNGQRNAQDLPSANYYFVIDLKREGEPVRKGSLTILR